MPENDNDWGAVGEGSEVGRPFAPVGAENTSAVKVDKRSKEYKESLKNGNGDNGAVGASVTPASEKRFRLIISENKDSTEGNTVSIGVNGKPYRIRRGVEVVVPESVITVLRESNVSKEEKENGAVVTRVYPRFPYSVLGEVRV